MKKLFAIVAVVIAAIGLSACGQKSAEQKVEAKVASVYALNAEERALAQTNAKQFYEKDWPVVKGSERTSERGVWIECRPSDSNFNGLVSCSGQVPQINGGFKEVKRYCGYRKDLVGCSDEDAVK